MSSSKRMALDLIYMGKGTRCTVSVVDAHRTPPVLILKWGESTGTYRFDLHKLKVLKRTGGVTLWRCVSSMQAWDIWHQIIKDKNNGSTKKKISNNGR